MARNSRFIEMERFLVGDNPFIGVDHLSRERARDRVGRLDADRIIEVIETALANGAQALSFSTHEKMLEVLRRMKETSYARPFGLFPLLPYAQDYVRLANEKGMIGLARDVLSKLSWGGKAKTLLGGGLSLVSPDPIRILKTYLDVELDILLRNVPTGASLRSVILHEIVTDLAASLETKELIQAYVHHMLDEYNVRPGFATRNFPKFVAFAREAELDLNQVVILTPFNKLGFQMNPSREASEQALSLIDSDPNIVAMSILASGYLNLSEALAYLKKLPKIRSYVVGVSTRAHAEQTFSLMSESMGSSPRR